ncbi:MAG: MarR family transcriptional regulator [Actinomycetota bacterium]|nr:MarR family transcriptional regulator [Actinomycetota bacterium]
MAETVSSRQHVVNSGVGRSPAGDAFTRLLMLVFPLERRMSQAGEALARTAGQTLARWIVLETVQGHPATVADIGRQLGLARQGVQRLADALVLDGLAAYHDNPRHQRAKLLQASDEGQRVLTVIQQAQAAWSDRVGELLGLAPLVAAGDALKTVLATVTDTMPDPANKRIPDDVPSPGHPNRD